MKIRKISFIIIFLTSFSSIHSQPFDSDIRWRIIDSPLVFPSNFSEWMLRNLDLPNKMVAGRPFGEIILTDQTNNFIDFNQDGKKDIVLELIFDSYMSDTLRQARQRFYKGIFLAQSDGKYHLDTNYIITERGYEDGGEFGDFNGDGLLDYVNTVSNYHGDQNLKPLDLYKYGNDLSPSYVFMNSGKGFSPIYLDTVFFGATGPIVLDIDNDKKDEIFALMSENYIIYKFNTSTGGFERKVLELNKEINKRFGRTINFISHPKLNNSTIMTIVAYNNCFSPPCKNNNSSDLAILKVDLLNDRFEIMYTMTQASYVWPDGEVSTQGLYSGRHYTFADLDEKQPSEFIVLGGFTRMLNKGSHYYGERMGITVYKGSENVTELFYEKDTLDYMTKGLLGKIGNELAIFPNNGLSRSIQLDNATKEKYKYSYYRFRNGKFQRRKMQFDAKNLKLASMSTEIWNYIHDFNNDSLSDILLADSYDMRNAKMFFQVNCPDVIKKPNFNTSKYSFCSGDSLKLSITNVNKGDTLKWYYGTRSDLTNVANKTFTDSTKLYVTRTDSVGCIISSDTIQITKNSIPIAPGISRDSDNNLVANTNSITWYKDGVKIADTTQKIKPTSNGNYTATTTQNGCISPASANYYYLTSAVASLSSDEYFKFSPNPTNGEIYLNYNIRSTKDIYISIIDMIGRTIISNRKVNNGSRLNLESSMKGNYIIQVRDKTGKILTTEKLIKN